MPLDRAWVALSLMRHVGSKTLHALTQHFGSTEAVLQASAEELQAVRGVGKKIAESITAIDRAQVERKIQAWQASGVMMLPTDAAHYPQPLHTLEDAPATLFIRGDHFPHPWRPAAAIIGTRNPSQEARKTAFDLGASLAAQGWIIVSGLALGVDEAAHKGALSTNGLTVAVLGGGVLNVYPRQNYELARKIMESGALLGENAPDADASPPRLVSRNRIISGLCQHVIVVETSINGGAMYAAKAAITQGRTLHAVGYPASGNLQLLKEGARYIPPDGSDYSLPF